MKLIKKIGKIVIKTYSAYSKANFCISDGIVTNGNLIFGIQLSEGSSYDSIEKVTPDVQSMLSIPQMYFTKHGPYIYLILSNKTNKTKELLSILSSQAFLNSNMEIPLAIGCDEFGNDFIADLHTTKHILLGGPTGSGKSVGLKCAIASIMQQSVDKVNLILIDTGMDDLHHFDGIPHLSFPVIEDAEIGFCVIMKLIDESKRRKHLCREEKSFLPAIVCVIDEYPEFISEVSNRKSLENAISKLLQTGRHTKIYLIISAQNPSADNIGTDVANITTRISFKCIDNYKAKTILGKSGAENLSGKGQLLFRSDFTDIKQLQGSFISDEELSALVEQIKMANYDLSNKFIIPEQIIKEIECIEKVNVQLNVTDKDEILNEKIANALFLALETGKISQKAIEDKDTIGGNHNTSKNILLKLEEWKIISPPDRKNPCKARNVLPKSINDILPGIIEYLNRYGYSREQIEATFEQNYTDNESITNSDDQNEVIDS